MDAPNEDDSVCVKRICMENAYKFVGIGEFVARPLDAHTVRQAARNSFEERPKSVGYGEVELFRFQQWYQDFRFAQIIDNPIDGEAQWFYSLIVINPKAPDAAFTKHKAIPPRIEKFKDLVLKFYVSGFAQRGTTVVIPR